jgi:hypothetical protein
MPRYVSPNEHLERLMRFAQLELARYDRSCAVCGLSLSAKRRDAITCGDACRKRRLRARARGLELPQRRHQPISADATVESLLEEFDGLCVLDILREAVPDRG